jgi:hypothetical protein
MPSIKEKLEKSKYLVSYLQNTWFFVGFTLILAILVVFGAIKLDVLFQNRPGITIAKTAFDTNVSGKEGSYVASKNSDLYYFPWCGIVSRIKDKNKVWFASRIDAEKAGYKPSANCHGLK